jgi:hypothetical protein
MKSTDVQIFTPTPGTLSTAIYYSEFDPFFKSIPVEKRISELMERKKLLSS